jgi:hypothetical protein
MRNGSRHLARIETQACRDLVAGPKLFADTPRGFHVSWTVGSFFPIQNTGTVRLDRVGSVGLCVSDAVADITCFAATLRRVDMWPGL